MNETKPVAMIGRDDVQAKPGRRPWHAPEFFTENIHSAEHTVAHDSDGGAGNPPTQAS